VSDTYDLYQQGRAHLKGGRAAQATVALGGVELGHHGKECSFDAIVKKHALTSDPALVLLARIVNGADTDNSLWNQPESAGLKDCALGLAPNIPASCRKVGTGGMQKPVSKSAKNESRVSNSVCSRRAIAHALQSPGVGSKRGSLTTRKAR
jgi:hypothetical protein